MKTDDTGSASYKPVTKPSAFNAASGSNDRPASNEDQREVLLQRRREVLARMWTLREKAIAEGLELWDEERLQHEMDVDRGRLDVAN